MVEITTSTYEHLWGNWAIGLVSICILYYDWLLCLGDEVEQIWLKGRRLSAASMLYFLTRYLALLSHVPTSVALFATRLPLQTCRNMQFVHFIATAVIQVTTGVVFILRVHALYQNRLVLGTVIAIAAAGLVMAAWSIATSFTSHHAPDIYILGIAGCNPVMRKAEAMHFAITWAGLSIFDLTIFLLTMYKAVCAHGKDLSRLWYIFMRDGAAYFVYAVSYVATFTCLSRNRVIFLANLGNIICFLIAPPVLKGVTGLLTNVLSATLVSRLILNLRAASETRSTPTAFTSEHELQIVRSISCTGMRDMALTEEKYELDTEDSHHAMKPPTPFAY